MVARYSQSVVIIEAKKASGCSAEVSTLIMPSERGRTANGIHDLRKMKTSKKIAIIIALITLITLVVVALMVFIPHVVKCSIHAQAPGCEWFLFLT